MKNVVIQLTDEQIDVLIKSEKDFLLQEKQKELNDIEKKYDILIEKLSSKYKNFSIKIEDETEKKTIRKKVDNDVLKKLFEEGKDVDEMMEATGLSGNSVRNRLSKLGLKLSERK